MTQGADVAKTPDPSRPVAVNPLLAVSGVRRSFGDVVALDGIDLEIHENEFFALLGPSGCGKTTLLRILAGFEDPDTGEVALEGADLLRLPPNKRPVNLMFQSYALFPHMSVERNVAYGLEREGRPKGEIRTRVGEVLETVGLVDESQRRPHQLSGGQRQRVALARAIVKRPRLLLLDEPLSALDKKVRAEMQRELKRLQHEVGITFAVVTHDQEEAMSMADRIAVMHHGRIQQVAPPVTLYRQPSNVFVADFIGTSNFFVGRRSQRGLSVDTLGDLPGVGDITFGDDAHLMVRPENVRIVEHSGLVVGRVVDVQFYGGVSTLAVEVEGRTTPVLVTLSGTARSGLGDRVTLAWDPEDGVLLAATEA